MSTAQTGTEMEREPSILMEAANEMVRLFKDQFGRGPSSARAAWAGPDVLTVVLEHTFTASERRLVRMGQHERLRDLRSLLQYDRTHDFCAPIERLTGRTVRAFISGVDTEADGLSVETFVLHPPGYDGPSRGDSNG
jgi:uncharacterized protein YbcI